MTTSLTHEQASTLSDSELLQILDDISKNIPVIRKQLVNRGHVREIPLDTLKAAKKTLTVAKGRCNTAISLLDIIMTDIAGI